MNIAHVETPSTGQRRFALASREPRATITIDGVDLAVHDSAPASSKPIIVCLHAIGHGGADFAAFEDAFAATHRIITIDWPGQGASGHDTQPASAARYGALFAPLVDRLALRRFVVFGNSIGGAVAVAYAAENPDRVRALILSNPGGFDPGGFFARLFIGHLVRRFRAGVDGATSYRKWFERYYARILVTAEAAAERDAIVASAYEIAPRLAEAWDSFRRPEADLRPLIARVTMPVLFAWAAEDRLVRFARSRKAIEQFPNHRVVMFRAGHSPFLETPRELEVTVREFLDSLRDA